MYRKLTLFANLLNLVLNYLQTRKQTKITVLSFLGPTLTVFKFIRILTPAHAWRMKPGLNLIKLLDAYLGAYICQFNGFRRLKVL